MSDPYYLAYENRYQKVFKAGAERWGHSPDDEILVSALSKWVNENKLKGKKVIEFACGEGASGEILSMLGCIYHGVDIAPSAVEKAKIAIQSYPNASVSLLDMVNQQVSGTYDAVLDVMGFHMLVLDSDRLKYLKNAFECLKNGAPMLFFRESYRVNAPNSKIESIDQWKSITGEDYDTPQNRTARGKDKDIDVYIPLVPARARTKDGYLQEMNEIGFIVDKFIEMDINEQCSYSASIYVHKP
jgi:hypothetical protein